MLSDVELFIVTWILAVGSFISLGLFLYTSKQLVGHEFKQQRPEEVLPINLRFSRERTVKARNVSALLAIVCALAGLIVSLTNLIPVTQYNESTVWFRLLSVQSSLFLLELVFCGAAFCAARAKTLYSVPIQYYES